MHLFAGTLPQVQDSRITNDLVLDALSLMCRHCNRERTVMSQLAGE